MENKDVYFNYLEELRQSGVTNMFGAAPYLEANFEELNHAQAVEILKEWMQNYNELSKRLGWDKGVVDAEESGEEVEMQPEEKDYYNLFHETVDKGVINSFLKQLAEEDLMDELNNADHIWYVEGYPFIIKFRDGNIKYIFQGDDISIYDDIVNWAEDFGFDPSEVVSKIKAETDLDVDVSDESGDTFEDEEEVIEYGSDKVVPEDDDSDDIEEALNKLSEKNYSDEELNKIIEACHKMLNKEEK